jgi:hypothetical protein
VGLPFLLTLLRGRPTPHPVRDPLTGRVAAALDHQLAPAAYLERRPIVRLDTATRRRREEQVRRSVGTLRTFPPHRPTSLVGCRHDSGRTRLVLGTVPTTRLGPGRLPRAVPARSVGGSGPRCRRPLRDSRRTRSDPGVVTTSRPVPARRAPGRRWGRGRRHRPATRAANRAAPSGDGSRRTGAGSARRLRRPDRR